MEKLLFTKENKDLKEMMELLKGLNTEQKQLAKGIIVGLKLSEQNRES